ncbi:putative glycine-rich protein [Penicillium digitatum]|uniref:Putative glycine-rich protein n=3 Tax=Penicillium digitatum TaxID=36651 RepID=K9GQ26_PEND2|nr:putative glycine-rich protein [Penicillium digitatum Pd1]EKV11349.1 putative glycine-rich protein [Penicillium digitatum Pd1]EKV16778.1 putative glycine-rich protein [Penicillium digitatum PHI26]KAG0153054.1 hypothetical protein PDIDSM_2013 [Penicillium digitatum]QQK43835.1 putative glycine-rich protein [Penicillium digitatum]
MKFTWATSLLLLSTRVASLTVPQIEPTDLEDVDSLDLGYTQETSDIVTLEKRRGGGGGGGGGRGGSSGSSSSGGSSGGRTGSSGSSGSSGGRTGSSGSSGSGRSGSGSNVGGATSGGSGTRATYGGGNYYAGGARTPYRSGSRSAGGIAPYVLGGAALGFLPGLLLYSAYAYPYNQHYNYYNDNDRQNESLPIVCVCQEYSECGCDNNNNRTYYESLFNGTVPKNSSLVRVVDVNGTQTIYINGTLANGTTAADESSTGTSSASGPVAMVLHASGYWVTVAVVVAAVWGF